MTGRSSLFVSKTKVTVLKVHYTHVRVFFVYKLETVAKLFNTIDTSTFKLKFQHLLTNCVTRMFLKQ